MGNPGLNVGTMELVQRERIIRGQAPESATENAHGVFLELWEDGRNGNRKWALALMDNYRDHLAKNSVRSTISDGVAGYIQRTYLEEQNDG